MKNLILCCLVLTVSLSFGQKIKTLQVDVCGNSKVYILGSTNVNEFRCDYNPKQLLCTKIISLDEKSDQILFDNVAMELLTNSFDCGNPRMNNDFQQLLQADQFPYIDIRLDKVEKYSSDYLKAYVVIEIASVAKIYDFPVRINEKQYIGKLRLNITDFGLEPPKKAFGLIKVDEEIEIHFELELSITVE